VTRCTAPDAMLDRIRTDVRIGRGRRCGLVVVDPAATGYRRVAAGPPPAVGLCGSWDRVVR
jgi:hypothetical protein